MSIKLNNLFNVKLITLSLMMSYIVNASAQTQWTYVGTFTENKWMIDTASIKYESPSLISFQIKGGSGAHFHMKLNCVNRTMSQAYQPFQAVPNTNNVVVALLNKFCFPIK